jgi:hypothetical protein
MMSMKAKINQARINKDEVMRLAVAGIRPRRNNPSHNVTSYRHIHHHHHGADDSNITTNKE